MFLRRHKKKIFLTNMYSIYWVDNIGYLLFIIIFLIYIYLPITNFISLLIIQITLFISNYFDNFNVPISIGL